MNCRFWAPLLGAVLLATACGDSNDPAPADAAVAADAAGGSADAGAGTADAASGVADTGAAADGGTTDTGVSDVGSAAVTYQTLKPLFAQKCTPCHATGGNGAGSHTLATEYRTATNPATASACAGKRMGECTIVLVKSGFMPLGRGCTGDPAMDSGKPACLTAAEQKQLEDWIAAGIPER